jgi:hypothetical protein
VNVFPNVTTDTDFAVLGLQANAYWPVASSSSLISSGFAVRFDAASDAYVIDLPSAPAGKLDSRAESNRSWEGRLADNAGNVIPEPILEIFKPVPTNPELALQHTTFGTFYDYDSGWYDYDGDGLVPFGAFAFGTATPAGGVPTTGSAVFDAMIAGFALDTGNRISGTGSLQFDFGAGTLAGSLNPTVYNASAVQVGLGSYGFVNTVFGVGSTTYSGQLQHAGTASLGAFNGMFTGPAAQELMAKWTAPYKNPDNNQWFEMFGVWVGKKQ